MSPHEEPHEAAFDEPAAGAGQGRCTTREIDPRMLAAFVPPPPAAPPAAEREVSPAVLAQRRGATAVAPLPAAKTLEVRYAPPEPERRRQSSGIVLRGLALFGLGAAAMFLLSRVLAPGPEARSPAGETTSALGAARALPGVEPGPPAAGGSTVAAAASGAPVPATTTASEAAATSRAPPAMAPSAAPRAFAPASPVTPAPLPKPTSPLVFPND